MNCRTARKLFSLRIDKGLSYEKESKLIEHLEACPECASEYEGFEQAVAMVRELPDIPPSETFLEDVMQSVREAKAAETSPPPVGLRERLSEWFGGFAWSRSPVFAPAALILGLAVGLSGAMIVFNSSTEAPTFAGEPAQSSGPVAGMASDSDINDIDTPAPSGRFEELVQDMLRRAETTESEDTEAQTVPDLEWGPPLQEEYLGRQVGTSTEDRRERDSRDRVIVAF